MEAVQLVKGRSLPMNGENGCVILHDFPPPDMEKLWRDCLSRVEAPAHYNCPEFFLEPLWTGKRPFAMLALDRGSVVGVLTGLHEGTQVISGLQSRPQICVDKTANTETALGNLARGLLAEADKAKLVTVYSWSRMPLDAFESYGFRPRTFEGDIVLDLTKGPDTLFKQMNKKRQKLRNAMRNGVEIFQATTAEHAQMFYRIYLTWRQTERKTIEGEQIPLAVFEQRVRQRDSFRVFLARYSGQVIAGMTLRFAPEGLVECSNNSSLDDFLYLRPNDLLMWKAVEWACSAGFRRMSLGGAHRFLREFGGEVEPIRRYRLDRTMLRRHDLQEATLDLGRETVRQFPRPVQRAIRGLLGKNG